MNLVAPLVFASLLAAAPTASAHDGRAGHGSRFPFPLRSAPTLRIATPRFAIEFGGCRPRHEHRFSYACEREWSAPVYETRIAGYDCHRRPIWRRVLVRAGCFTEVRYRACACGTRVRC